MMYADLLLELLEGELKTYAQKLHDSIWRSTEILKNVASHPPDPPGIGRSIAGRSRRRHTGRDRDFSGGVDPL